jgi:hypothetical protein
VNPVPESLLLRKSGNAENWTRDLWICGQELWPLDHRGDSPYQIYLGNVSDEILLRNSGQNCCYTWNDVMTKWFMTSFCKKLKNTMSLKLIAMQFSNYGYFWNFLEVFVLVRMFQVQSSQDLCRRQKVPSLGFSETAEAAFRCGPPGLQRFSTAGR